MLNNNLPAQDILLVGDTQGYKVVTNQVASIRRNENDYGDDMTWGQSIYILSLLFVEKSRYRPAEWNITIITTVKPL